MIRPKGALFFPTHVIVALNWNRVDPSAFVTETNEAWLMSGGGWHARGEYAAAAGSRQTPSEPHTASVESPYQN